MQSAETGGQARDNILFWVAGTSDKVKSEIRSHIKYYYPGLLENGVFPWETLDRRRHRRFGGVPQDIVNYIQEEYNNAVNDEHKLNAENFANWPRKLSMVFSCLRSPVPVHTVGNVPAVDGNLETQWARWDIPGAGGHQLVYTSFPKASWDGRLLQAFESVRRNLDEGKHIVNPWNNPSNQNNVPRSRWNPVLNHSVGNIAMQANSQKHPYPLRLIVPRDPELLKSITVRSGIHETRMFDVCAVLLLRYIGGHNTETPSRRATRDESFVPLFIVLPRSGQSTLSPEASTGFQKSHEKYRLFNYRGDSVEWGDFSKRKTQNYYEIRETMAHLATPDPKQRWVALTPVFEKEMPESVLQHLLIRRYTGNEAAESVKLAEEQRNCLERVCIVWNETNDGLKVSPWTESTPCRYEGSGADFDGRKDWADFELESLFIPYDLDNMTRRSDYEEDLYSPEAFVPSMRAPNTVSRPPLWAFGLYTDLIPSCSDEGEGNEESVERTVITHISSAMTQWNKWVVNNADKNPVHPYKYLTKAIEQAKWPVMTCETDHTLRGGDGAGDSSVTSAALGFLGAVVLALACLAGSVTR
jgi:hypothetical protein